MNNKIVQKIIQRVNVYSDNSFKGEKERTSLMFGLTTSSWEILLKLKEELKLLELLILDDSSVHIVGIVGAPLKEGMMIVRDGPEAEWAGNAGHLVSRLRGDHLISEGVLCVRDLIDPQLPNSPICIGDAHDGVKLVWGSRCPLGWLYVAGEDFLQLKVLEDTPGLFKRYGEDATLKLMGRYWDGWSWTASFHLIKVLRSKILGLEDRFVYLFLL